MDQAGKAEGKLKVAEKAHAEVEKKLKETLAQLTEAKKAQRNAEDALNNFKNKRQSPLRLSRRWKTSWPKPWRSLNSCKISCRPRMLRKLRL